MEHPFTWHSLLPESWQSFLPQHTFFALLVLVVLVLFGWSARRAIARARDPVVPVEGLGVRNLAELLVQFVMLQSDAIIGRQGRKYVPLFGSFFIFILLSNLLGLVPGFSPPTSNLNTTLGLALVSFFAYNFIGLREQGAGYLKHFLGPMTSLPSGKSRISSLLFVPVLLVSMVFFLILESASHLFRPLSLSLRLFGNMFGDHMVIEVFIELTKLIIPIAFYALGALVAVIQAFVFTMLSMIYVALAVSDGHEEGHEHH
ncbi:MAG: F0F1 ATP synthase subunit A [Deltaproteobacteria bacterium]|nr:F0F1 ATP synthase subunit A [Deltaproteobacteria bacterium]